MASHVTNRSQNSSLSENSLFVKRFLCGTSPLGAAHEKDLSGDYPLRRGVVCHRRQLQTNLNHVGSGLNYRPASDLSAQGFLSPSELTAPGFLPRKAGSR